MSSAIDGEARAKIAALGERVQAIEDAIAERRKREVPAPGSEPVRSLRSGAELLDGEEVR